MPDKTMDLQVKYRGPLRCRSSRVALWHYAIPTCLPICVYLCSSVAHSEFLRGSSCIPPIMTGAADGVEQGHFLGFGHRAEVEEDDPLLDPRHDGRIAQPQRPSPGTLRAMRRGE